MTTPSPDTIAGIEHARALRAELGLDALSSPGCLVALAEERLGLPVCVVVLPGQIDGWSFRRPAGGVVLWVNGANPPVRRRFTLAHELGHIRCGHDGDSPQLTIQTVEGKATTPVEIQANAFAGELLAPADGVRAAAATDDVDLEAIARVAATFGLSMIAALYRCNRIGIAPRYGQLKATIEIAGAAPVRDGENGHDDLLARLDKADLPRFSPLIGGSALVALAAGRTSLAGAAHAAGRSAAALAGGAGLIGI